MAAAEDPIHFSVLEGKFCMAKLPPGSDLGSWSSGGAFCSTTCSDEEISIVCIEDTAPPFAEIERNWKGLKVQGPLDFALQGVLLSLLQPLSDAGIAVFVLSTYSTDYIFVKQYHLQKAIEALQAVGHVRMDHALVNSE
jgi:uncharacterized protein